MDSITPQSISSASYDSVTPKSNVSALDAEIKLAMATRTVMSGDAAECGLDKENHANKQVERPRSRMGSIDISVDQEGDSSLLPAFTSAIDISVHQERISGSLPAFTSAIGISIDQEEKGGLLPASISRVSVDKEGNSCPLPTFTSILSSAPPLTSMSVIYGDDFYSSTTSDIVSAQARSVSDNGEGKGKLVSPFSPPTSIISFPSMLTTAFTLMPHAPEIEFLSAASKESLATSSPPSVPSTSLIVDAGGSSLFGSLPTIWFPLRIPWYPLQIPWLLKVPLTLNALLKNFVACLRTICLGKITWSSLRYNTSKDVGGEQMRPRKHQRQECGEGKALVESENLFFMETSEALENGDERNL